MENAQFLHTRPPFRVILGLLLVSHQCPKPGLAPTLRHGTDKPTASSPLGLRQTEGTRARLKPAVDAQGRETR